jgi:hypothetical protein
MGNGFRACRIAAAIGATVAAAMSCGCDGGAPGRGASPAVLGEARAPTVVSAEAWSFNGESGRLLRTNSYRLYTTEGDPYLLDRLPVFLEAALVRYRTGMGPLPEPPMKLDTFLMSTRAQWEALTRQAMGAGAGPYLRIQRGGFSSGGRAMLWSIGRHDTLSIAAHEGWHQYTQRTFKQWLPVWLEEGIATYMEGFTADPSDPLRPVFAGWANVERFDQLRSASSRGGLMSLPELLGAEPQDLIGGGADGALTYYAQVWALVHFLREGEGGRYRRGLELMVLDAAEGRMARVLSAAEGADGVPAVSGRGREAFAAYFAADLGTVSSEYAAFVDRVVAVGSRDRIVAGRSPLE